MKIQKLGIVLMGLLLGGSLAQAADWNVGGEVRVRGEQRQASNFTETIGVDRSIAQRTRVNVGVQEENREVFFQIQDTRTWGFETTTATDMKNTDLHQAYLAFGNNWRWKLGRQELAYGKERLIGAFGWNNVGRAFDALKLTVPMGENKLDVFWSQLAGGTTTTATNDDTFLNGLAYLGNGYELYVFSKNDQATATGVTALGYHQSAAAYDFELVYEGGSVGASTLQAYAFDGIYKLGLGTNSFLGLGLTYASGDDNAADTTVKTFDNLYPTNHDKYGFMDQIGWRNLMAYRIEYEMPLGEVSKLIAQYHIFNKATGNDAVYTAAGTVHAANSGSTNTAVGSELDLVYKTSLEKNVPFETGVGYFTPGTALSGTTPQLWGYIQTGIKF